MTQEETKEVVKRIVDEMKEALDGAPREVQDYVATTAIRVIALAVAFTAKFPENPTNVAAFKAMLRAIAKMFVVTAEQQTRGELEAGLVNCEGTTTLQ